MLQLWILLRIHYKAVLSGVLEHNDTTISIRRDRLSRKDLNASFFSHASGPCRILEEYKAGSLDLVTTPCEARALEGRTSRLIDLYLLNRIQGRSTRGSWTFDLEVSNGERTRSCTSASAKTTHRLGASFWAFPLSCQSLGIPKCECKLLPKVLRQGRAVTRYCSKGNITSLRYAACPWSIGFLTECNLAMDIVIDECKLL